VGISPLLIHVALSLTYSGACSCSTKSSKASKGARDEGGLLEYAGFCHAMPVPLTIQGKVQMLIASHAQKSITSKDYSGATYWVEDARWVISGPETPEGSGKTWTTSGVSAGTDGMMAWIATIYGEEIAQVACDWMEYRQERSSDDAYFAQVWDYQDVPFRHPDAATAEH
jgi:hypothetical protein